MNGPARVPGEPGFDLGVLVHGVVVENDMDGFALRHLALDGVEEADERLVAMPLPVAADDPAVEAIERGEQCRRSVRLWRLVGDGCGGVVRRQSFDHLQGVEETSADRSDDGPGARQPSGAEARGTARGDSG